MRPETTRLLTVIVLGSLVLGGFVLAVWPTPTETTEEAGGDVGDNDEAIAPLPTDPDSPVYSTAREAHESIRRTAGDELVLHVAGSATSEAMSPRSAPPEGRHYVHLELLVHWAGPARLSFLPADLTLITSAGANAPTPSQPAEALPGVRIPFGATVRGWVAFEVPVGAALETLAWTTPDRNVTTTLAPGTDEPPALPFTPEAGLQTWTGPTDRLRVRVDSVARENVTVSVSTTLRNDGDQAVGLDEDFGLLRLDDGLLVRPDQAATESAPVLPNQIEPGQTLSITWHYTTWDATTHSFWYHDIAQALEIGLA